MPAEPIDPISLEIPAPFVNKIQIIVAGPNVRISFGEAIEGQAVNYRSAVVLTAQDAKGLAQAILDSLPSVNFYSGLFGSLPSATRPLTIGEGNSDVGGILSAKPRVP